MSSPRLLATLAVLCLLVFAIVGCDQFGGAPVDDKQATKDTKALVERIDAAIRDYKQNHGFDRYPTDNIGGDTNNLAKELADNGFYEFQEGERKGNTRGEIIDAWGNALQYRVTGNIPEGNERKALQHNTDFDLYSPGPDGEYDTEDDIGNW